MTGEEMWAAWSGARGLARGRYGAWAFGEDPDGLARLVSEGVKTATSSAFPLYGREGEPLPEPGAHSVVLDGRGRAVCVVRTERVEVVPFREVDGEHARREGEGDLSLAYWRRVHEAFFAEELARAGLVFTPDMPVVCETFRKVYPD